jgi:predicted cupin superfamily sugar epimerase
MIKQVRSPISNFIDQHEVISSLKMKPHPEGGFYSETYRCNDSVTLDKMGHRSLGTSIYFLLPTGEVSLFHRLASDEIWHFHQGDSITVVMLKANGSIEKAVVGPVGTSYARPQVIIPKGTWFGAIHESEQTHEYTLVGCTVSPGFEFADFEMATRTGLLEEFKGARSQTIDFILKLTKP